ncbi:hypothetical protein HXX76_008807 [Chlamydomonas incerta]|uniref:BZIP domain-containing protein n=1 Tax=Chlamydomonas incerta TaxID=51695 RepID=A0A835VX09_CHLIN|nr:hypothetical protein HXX76_008807 [Chlamydomonas incerta]|eukprot:KAG2432462.1 hypothetical protein HXX76_008807 [Chlamydomonas incerta]
MAAPVEATAAPFEPFHFDTNPFLNEGGASAIDFQDLFRLLKEDGGAEGLEAAGLDCPQGSDGLADSPASSTGWVASPTPAGAAPVPAAPAASLVPTAVARTAAAPSARQAARNDTKAATDTTKRSREAAQGPKNKQHQLKELEELAAQKKEEMERLLRQNSELKFRHAILQKVVNMRDHQLKVMRGHANGPLGAGLTVPWGGATAAQPQPATASCSDASGTGGGVCGGGTPGTPQDLPASDGCGPSPAGAGAAPAGVTPDGSCGRLDGGGSAAELVRSTGCGQLLAPAAAPLPDAERERFRNLGKGQLIEGWKNYLSDVAVPLLALETDPGDEAAAAALARSAAAAAYLLKFSSLLAPDTLAMAMQTHLETEAPMEPEPGHWLPVVRTLELSAHQEAELRAVWGLYNGIMRAVVAERKGIMAKLATGVHGSTADIVRMMAQLTVSPECEVMQTLQRNMRREKSAHLLLRGYLYAHTLSTLQFVKASVYSYPWLPDATAIVAVVAEHGAGADTADTPAAVP